MTIVHQTQYSTVHSGDCLDVLKGLPDESVHAVITDPPYGLSKTTPEQVTECLREWATGNTTFTPAKRGGFMGKDWDSFVPPPAVWAECLRVLKPGGHLLAFAGSRTQDLMGMSVRLAGFDIRDNFAWLYGSGFPKSANVSKAIDNLRPISRELLPEEEQFCRWIREESGLSREQCADLFGNDRFYTGEVQVINTATKENPRMGRRSMVPTAAAWQKAGLRAPDWVEALVKTPPKPKMQTPSEWKSGKGHGTAGTNDWAGWGTALKPAFEPVIMARKPFTGTVAANVLKHGTGAINIDASRISAAEGDDINRARIGGFSDSPIYGSSGGYEKRQGASGRFPTNVLLDESQAAVLDEQSGVLKSGGGDRRGAKDAGIYGVFKAGDEARVYGPSEGGASRFFYCAKAPKSERPKVDGTAHPTVKPLTLMRYLIRMVTPPGGTVLDPFAGSGTTLEAATLEGFTSIGIEAHTDYLPLIAHRLERTPEPEETPPARHHAAA